MLIYLSHRQSSASSSFNKYSSQSQSQSKGVVFEDSDDDEVKKEKTITITSICGELKTLIFFFSLYRITHSKALAIVHGDSRWMYLLCNTSITKC